jgi:tight adherence protein C
VTVHLGDGRPGGGFGRYDGAIDRIARVARAVGVNVLTDSLERGKLARLMAEAGLRRIPIEYGVSAKLATCFAFAAVGTFFIPHMFPRMPDILAFIVGAAGFGLLGWRVPDIVMTRMASSRKDQIDRGMPDALDLLVICAEAGLGLETAMDRIGGDTKTSHPQLSEELLLTSAEIRMLPDRTQALENFATRTGVQSTRIIVTTLGQTLRYGTPLSQALRILSEEMRTKRLLDFENRAGRLPVLLTVPMIVFLIPSIMLIVGGPAFLQIIQTIRLINN